MPWTKKDYPDSMKNLDTKVRNKAIDIANAILEEDKEKDEGIIIATAISRAKDWAANKEKKDSSSSRRSSSGKKTTSKASTSGGGKKKTSSKPESKKSSSAKSKSSSSGKKSSSKESGSSRKTDVKKHGKDQYVSATEEGWAVKEEGTEKRRVYKTKSQALKTARSKAKKANATVTVKDKNGRIAKRKSYNPHNKSRNKSK